jgi:hypothetical protein
MARRWIKFLSLSSLLLFVPGSSLALNHDWTRVDLNHSGYDDKYYMDLGSFVIKDKEVVFWGSLVSPGGFKSVQRVSIDCAKGRYMVLEFRLYNKSGGLVEEDASPTEWLPISAASFYGYLQPLVCVKKGPRPFTSLTGIGAMIYNIRSLRGYDE